MPEKAHENEGDIGKLHKDIGQTGHFGEFFVGLGLLILLGGVVMSGAGHLGFMPDDHGKGGDSDAILSGWLFIFEGAGFIIFGIVAILSGWARSHPEYDG